MRLGRWLVALAALLAALWLAWSMQHDELPCVVATDVAVADVRLARAWLAAAARAAPACELHVAVRGLLRAAEERQLRALGAQRVEAAPWSQAVPVGMLANWLALEPGRPAYFINVRAVLLQMPQHLGADPWPPAGATTDTVSWQALSPASSANVGQAPVCRATDTLTWEAERVMQCGLVFFATQSAPWAWWTWPGAGPRWAMTAAFLWLHFERSALAALEDGHVNVPGAVAWRNGHWQATLCPWGLPLQLPRTLIADRFTVLISTHSARRAHMLDMLVRGYAAQALVEEVVVVWHHVQDQARANATVAQWADLAPRVRLARPAHDSLNNRFVPWPGLRTAGVLVCDDDIELPAANLTFLFEVWQQHRDALVGVYSRVARAPSGSEPWEYVFAEEGWYNLLLTKVVMMHVGYLFQYTCLAPPQVHQLVDELVNCEDLAINMLAAAVSGQGPVRVPVAALDRGVDAPEALSSRPKHYADRSTCLSRLARAFNLSQLPMVRHDAVPHIGFL